MGGSLGGRRKERKAEISRKREQTHGRVVPLHRPDAFLLRSFPAAGGAAAQRSAAGGQRSASLKEEASLALRIL